MPDDTREVTTFCPRCGRPIVWSVRPFEGGEQLEVSAFACHCALRDDEWDGLADAAGDALQDRHDADERGVRRVREDGPA